MIGGRGERVVEVNSEDLAEISMPAYAKSFKEREVSEKENAIQKSQGIVEAYAAIVELENSEGGIVFEPETARKKLIELVKARNSIVARFGITGAIISKSGERFVFNGGTQWAVKGAHTKSAYGSGIDVRERNLELEKNFETIRVVLAAYEQLEDVFEDFDGYMNVLCEEYKKEVEGKAEQRQNLLREAEDRESEQLKKNTLEKLKVETLAAKRAATGSKRSRLTNEEIKELASRVIAAKPSAKPKNVLDLTEDEKESMSRISRTQKEEYSMKELEREIESLGR
jgi:hypothetical protein